MPDARLGKKLLSTARRLIPGASRNASQSDLRRSVSTCYYAVFHILAKSCADSLVGSRKSSRPNKAWVEIYRGLSHTTCKEACRRARSVNFPEAIQEFAEAFVQLQDARHLADYDPIIRMTREDSKFYLTLAERSILSLSGAPALDRKAFATWILITSQGARAARHRFQHGIERQVGG